MHAHYNVVLYQHNQLMSKTRVLVETTEKLFDDGVTADLDAMRLLVRIARAAIAEVKPAVTEPGYCFPVVEPTLDTESCLSDLTEAAELTVLYLNSLNTERGNICAADLQGCVDNAKTVLKTTEED